MMPLLKRKKAKSVEEQKVIQLFIFYLKFTTKEIDESQIWKCNEKNIVANFKGYFRRSLRIIITIYYLFFSA